MPHGVYVINVEVNNSINKMFIAYERNRAIRGDVSISVTKNGGFGFSSRFIKENSLEGQNYVLLFFDGNNSNKRIGFKFISDSSNKNKFKVFGTDRKIRGYGGNVVATSFFKENNMDANVLAGTYSPKKIEVENVGVLYVIELK